MSVELQFGSNAIVSYRRLAYKPWHAIAEFVDNSTQAYFDNRKSLDEAFDEDEGLRVDIVYDREEALLRVYDNSIGMDHADLQHAMTVAARPENPNGRSRYGMGLKTASCWIGDTWKIQTSKLGSTDEHVVKVDVNAVSSGDMDLPYKTTSGVHPDEHYTIIEITDHNRDFYGRTIGKIKDYLRSMYREDLRNGRLTLTWQGNELQWEGPDLLKAKDGSEYRREFQFDTSEGNEVRGWVGILESGSRANAGFSILVSGRVIKGWPDSWRPSTIFGSQQGGTNNLINQRIVGEVHLDDFEVSHTKDDILWFGGQEEEVEGQLEQECKEYVEFAKDYRPTKEDNTEGGPSDTETETAVDELKRELQSPEMVDKITLDPMPPEDVVEETVSQMADNVESGTTPTQIAEIGDLLVKLFLVNDLSMNDPYVTVEATKREEVLVIVNQNHPHWKQLSGSDGVLNYLRHCVYDGIAESRARSQASTLNPNTIKLIKDRFLRLPMEIQEGDDDDVYTEEELTTNGTE